MADDQPRPRTTAAQRAVDALEVANRKVKKIEGRVASLEADLKSARDELAEAKSDRDYKALNPALPKDVRDAHSVGPAAVASADGQPPTGASAGAPDPDGTGSDA